MNKSLIFIFLVLLIIGCSDSGEAPMEPEIPVTPMLSVNDISIIEGITGSFRISLNKKADSLVILDYFTKDSTALSGTDYTSVSITRDTINIGDSLIIVFVPTNSTDGLKEPAEYFELNVIVQSGAEVTDSVGVGKILDTDSERFSTFIQPLLIQSCALILCHSPQNPNNAAGGMYLGQATYQDVINATGSSTGGKVIIPDSSAQSTLHQRLLNSTPVSIRMPQGGPYFSADTISRIAEWIDFGAQEN